MQEGLERSRLRTRFQGYFAMFSRVLFVLMIMLPLSACDDGSDNPNLDDRIVTEAEAEATEVLERHMVARNNSDSKGIADEYNYTEIRLSGTGIQRTYTVEEAIFWEEEVVMPILESSGWNKSEWDNINIVQSSSNKAHFELLFSRLDTEGHRYRTSPTFWVVTNQSNKWGIKLRSSYVDESGTGEDIAEAEAEAIKILERRLEARNSRNTETLAALNSYPLVYLPDTDLNIFETNDEYILYEETVVIPELDYSEWGHSEWGELEVIQSSGNKVHIAARLDQFEITGEKYLSQDQFYVIVNFFGDWKIQALSNFVDAIQRSE